MKLFSAGTSILDRYQAHGIPYEMEEDKVVIAGPSWLEFGLKYEPVMNGDETGKVHIAFDRQTEYSKQAFLAENSQTRPSSNITAHYC